MERFIQYTLLIRFVVFLYRTLGVLVAVFKGFIIKMVWSVWYGIVWYGIILIGMICMV